LIAKILKLSAEINNFKKLKKLKYKIKLYFKKAFAKGTTINEDNVKSAAFIGSIGHPLFAILHLYVFQMPWDSIPLKICSAFICLFLLTRNKWPLKLKPLFPFYWHFMLIFNLPFLITLTALNNSFIKTWFLWELIMIFILIMYVPNWLIVLFDLAIGFLSALFVHSFTGASGMFFFDPAIPSSDNFVLDLIMYLSTFAFAILSGLIFSYSNAKGIASEERAKIFKSLAGSIAHELRNPLNAINLIGSQINELASDLDNQKGKHHDVKLLQDQVIRRGTPGTAIMPSAKKQLFELTSQISEAISGANDIINIILSDLSEKTIDPSDFFYLNPSEILPEILDKYGYKNADEKSKIKLLFPKEGTDDLLFKAIPDRFTFIIYNLLKNAFYYLNDYPESIVTIGNEVKKINGIEYNIIYVHDTGPGIPPTIISKLFGNFYTASKKEGTGLGLAFCKRNMRVFGGEIICESKFGNGKAGWTKFSLLFPKISKEEIERVKTESRKKKILLVDDQEINLINIKSKIEKSLFYVSCDVARSGIEAINMAKQNKYQLILMDIQMPEMNGIEATKKIRNHDKEIPIIALTSLSKKSFLEEANISSGFNANKTDFNYYISKKASDNILYRGVNKWMMGVEDDLAYVGTKDEYLKILQGKKALLADDQQLNRMMIKKSLERSGLEVVEASDGKELLEIYQKSLDQDGKSSFDIIITDVNMPPHDGDDATKEIRNIESLNKINYHDEMPIIALSGDGDKEDIYHFFDCQMTDYFIKGNPPEILLKIIANYLAK
jgi:CheY-like chemotaxis protein